MSNEGDYYALMVIAKEHQAAVAEAVQALQKTSPVLQLAAQHFDQARAELRAEIQKAAMAAMRDAVTAECLALAAPLKLAADKAEKAADRTQAAAKAVNWLWLASALLLGVGLGWTGQWYFVSKDLQTLRDYAAATYEQTQPPEKPKGK